MVDGTWTQPQTCIQYWVLPAGSTQYWKRYAKLTHSLHSPLPHDVSEGMGSSTGAASELFEGSWSYTRHLISYVYCVSYRLNSAWFKWSVEMLHKTQNFSLFVPKCWYNVRKRIKIIVEVAWWVWSYNFGPYETALSCRNKRSMITPEAWTPTIMNSQCSSIKWFERSTKYVLPRI